MSPQHRPTTTASAQPSINNNLKLDNNNYAVHSHNTQPTLQLQTLTTIPQTNLTTNIGAASLDVNNIIGWAAQPAGDRSVGSSRFQVLTASGQRELGATDQVLQVNFKQGF